MDDAPTLLENRQATGHHWVGVPRRVAARRTASRSAPRSRSTRVAARSSSARSARAAATSRRATCARYFGLGEYSGPVDVEMRMPGGRRWRWQGLAGDRLHVLTLVGIGAASREPASPDDCAVRTSGRSGSCIAACSSACAVVWWTPRRSAGAGRLSAQARGARDAGAVSETASSRGATAFPVEREAAELEARLAELGRALRRRAPDRATASATGCSRRASAAVGCGPSRKRLTRVKRLLDVPAGHGSAARPGARLRAPSARSCAELVEDLRQVAVAEFLITAIERTSGDPPSGSRDRRALRHRRAGTKAPARRARGRVAT